MLLYFGGVPLGRQETLQQQPPIVRGSPQLATICAVAAAGLGSLPFCACVCMCVALTACLPALPVSLLAFLPACLLTCLACLACLPASLPPCLSACLPSCLLVCLSIRPSVRLCLYLPLFVRTCMDTQTQHIVLQELGASCGLPDFRSPSVWCNLETKYRPTFRCSNTERISICSLERHPLSFLYACMNMCLY